MAEREYRPGDDVPRSGIYLVIHEKHRKSHEAVVLKGAAFPECRECGQAVRYRPVEGGTPLDADADFKPGTAPERKP